MCRYFTFSAILCFGNALVNQAFVSHNLFASKTRITQLSAAFELRRGDTVDVSKESWSVIPDIFESLSSKIGGSVCLDDYARGQDSAKSYTFKEVNDMIIACAGALQERYGVTPDEAIAIFAENSCNWFLVDQAIMKSGACSVVRGSSAPASELDFIYRNSNCSGLVVDTMETLRALAQSAFLEENDHLYTKPKFVLILQNDGLSGTEISASMSSNVDNNSTLLSMADVVTFDELLNAGKGASLQKVSKDPHSRATIVYTSGTTSNPKGVILSHNNLLSQVRYNSFNRADGGKLDPVVGDTMLSILPCWHIFERSAEYCFLARGARLVYSSLRTFKSDLETRRPEYIIAVPRLYESLYKSIVANFKLQRGIKAMIIAAATWVSRRIAEARAVKAGLVLRDNPPSAPEKILAALKVALLWPLWRLADALVWKKVRENLGGRVKVLVSGGALLPNYLESFFVLTGMPLLAGYGLTETSPVVCNQLAEHKVVGSIGILAEHTQIKIVDPETGKEVPEGGEGVLRVKSPGVMQGYVNDPEATAQAFDAEGYFDTGDIVRRSAATGGDLVITGRYKDTIVLSNGENVAPQPIEDNMVGNSDLVDQAMLIGQDQRSMSAIVVLSIPALVARSLISAEQATIYTTLLEQVAAVRTGLAAGTSSISISSTGGSSSGSGSSGGSTGRRRSERAGGGGKGGLVSSADAAVLQALKVATAELNPAIASAIQGDLAQMLSALKPWEKITSFILLLEPFSLANGQLTQTLKVKRHQVMTDYADIVRPFLPIGSSIASEKKKKK